MAKFKKKVWGQNTTTYYESPETRGRYLFSLSWVTNVYNDKDIAYFRGNDDFEEVVETEEPGIYVAAKSEVVKEVEAKDEEIKKEVKKTKPAKRGKKRG